MSEVKCPECRNIQVECNEEIGKFVCKICGHKWRIDVSLKNEDLSHSDMEYDINVDDSRENSEADGLFTLDEEDVLFPPEF